MAQALYLWVSTQGDENLYLNIPNSFIIHNSQKIDTSCGWINKYNKIL